MASSFHVRQEAIQKGLPVPRCEVTGHPNPMSAHLGYRSGLGEEELTAEEYRCQNDGLEEVSTDLEMALVTNSGGASTSLTEEEQVWHALMLSILCKRMS